MSRRVSPGDPLRIQAATWNKVQSLVEPKTGDIAVGANRRGLNPATYVRVRNATGSTVDRFYAMGISGMVVSPTDNLVEFKDHFAFTGAEPSSSYFGNWLVMQETVANGKMGIGIISGATVARINVNDADHEFVDVLDSGSTTLSSQTYGAGRIVWKESGTGNKWAILVISSVIKGKSRLAKSTVVIPARIGTVPGSAIVTLQKLEGGLLVDDGDPITVYSWVRQNSQTPAPSFYLFVSQDEYGTWWFTGEDCP